MILVYLMQVYLGGQQERWCTRGKLLLPTCQKFGIGINFCRNHMPSTPTNLQLDSGQWSMQGGWKKGNFVIQDEFLSPFDSINYIVLLKIPVITTQTWAPSQGRCLVQIWINNVSDLEKHRMKKCGIALKKICLLWFAIHVDISECDKKDWKVCVIPRQIRLSSFFFQKWLIHIYGVQSDITNMFLLYKGKRENWFCIYMFTNKQRITPEATANPYTHYLLTYHTAYLFVYFA